MSSPIVINEEYDIVIAGGGTAACVVASRLAAADTDLRVLLLEAGPTTYNNPIHTIPLNCTTNLAPGSRTVRTYVSHPSAALGGRPAVVQCAQCLGGGGSINFMMYTRPSASDFDDWETVYQNPGWGSKDLIPLLRKIENHHVHGAGPTHGTEGPLVVSSGGFLTDVASQFLQTAREFDPDRAHKPDDTDTNDLKTINVYTRWLKWINPETGKRSDVPHNMIYPLESARPNLHFLTGVHVKRVIFDEDVHIVKATKLVLVSAGAFGSPGILERSGIGARDVLERVGVEQRVDLPGVGKNYQDHTIFSTTYVAADETQSLDLTLLNDQGAIDAAAAQLGKTRKEILMQNLLDAGIKLRPSLAEVAELGPEFQKLWDTYYAHSPDKPLLWLGVYSAPITTSPESTPRKSYAVAVVTEYPLSRGHVHVTHAEDVAAPTDFVPGYLESKTDVQPLIWGYKFMREIARRMPYFRGELLAQHPAFAPRRPASLIEDAKGPVPLDAPRIVYSEEDERALEAFIRAHVSTCWHSLGTCAMKPREQGGVVDSQLNVYGVRGLKVADMSIAPANVSANTYGTALVIGEKAAVIIAEEFGIKLSSGLPQL